MRNDNSYKKSCGRRNFVIILFTYVSWRTTLFIIVYYCGFFSSNFTKITIILYYIDVYRVWILSRTRYFFDYTYYSFISLIFCYLYAVIKNLLRSNVNYKLVIMLICVMHIWPGITRLADFSPEIVKVVIVVIYEMCNSNTCCEVWTKTRKFIVLT